MLKKLITITMMTALLVTGMLALASCKEKEPISRPVELELIDPTRKRPMSRSASKTRRRESI